MMILSNEIIEHVPSRWWEYKNHLTFASIKKYQQIESVLLLKQLQKYGIKFLS